MPRVTSSESKSSVTDLREIRFGNSRGAIYRRSDIENSSWFFRTHLTKEKRYYRVSLKTTDRTEALQKAQSEMLKVLTKRETGQSVMAISLRLGQLVQLFSKHLAAQVASGQLRARTETMQRYRVRIGLKFLKSRLPDGLNARLDSIDGEMFKDYLAWRQVGVAAKRAGRTMRRDVVRDELIVIRKMFKFGQTMKLCTEKQIPKWDFTIEREPPKRRRIVGKNLIYFMEQLVRWRENADGEIEDYQRAMVMHLIIFVQSSGLRSGEVFGLTNRHAVPLNETEMRVTVMPETSKVGRERSIIVNAPMLIEFWLGHTQRFKDPDDYLFSPYKSGRTSVRDVFYHAYASLREQLKQVDLEWFDLYHFRHWYITELLLADQSIHLIAKAVGSSVAQIERTYSNVTTEQSTRKFNKAKIDLDEDGVVRVNNKPIH
jgi:site-specific recombinase XerC